MSTSPNQTPRQQQIADDIRVLTGLEVIRKHPGMYLGVTPHAIYDMLYEMLDNALNEALSGLCDRIEILIHPDSSVTISDNGEGMFVEVEPQLNISWLEFDLTRIAVPGRPSHRSYAVSGGLHGVGLQAVNALSEWLIAEVRRDGYLWRQSYTRGVRTSDVEKVRPLADFESTGTSITFYPDDEIFWWKSEHYDYNYDTLADRCRQLAYLLPSVTLRLIDQRGNGLPRVTIFCFEDGLDAFVKHLNQNRVPLHAPISGTKTVQLDRDYLNGNVAEVTFALQYTQDTHTTEAMFVNTLETPDGGTHLTGLRTALTRTLNQWARKTGKLHQNEVRLSGQDTRKGLTAVVSLKHPFPQFESQVKVRLMNPEVKHIVASTISGIFANYLEYNPDEAQHIFDHCRGAAENR